MELDKTKKIIIVMLLVIVILLIATSILKTKLKEDEKWIYISKDISNKVLQKASVTNNRVTYWELSNILDKYISTITSNGKNEESKNAYEDYYAILTSKYKKIVNKEEYNKKARNFIYKFIYKDPGNDEIYRKIDYSIKKIYEYGNDMYLCYVSVNTSNLEEYILNSYYKEDNQDIVKEIRTDGYIGIKLDDTKGTYEIFYIE